MSAQRYHGETARERMASELCPECGASADRHSSDPRFWARPSGCDLLPSGVEERIAQYQSETSEPACRDCGLRCDICGDRMCATWGPAPAVTCDAHRHCVDCDGDNPCRDCRSERRAA